MEGELSASAHPDAASGAAATAAAIDKARALLMEISALEAAHRAADQRLEALTALEPRVEAGLRELEASYAGLPQPLEPHALAALNLYRSVCQAAAEAWERSAGAVMAMPAGATRPRLAPLVFRAMRHVMRAMRTSYGAYSRLPQGTWKQAHRLYLLAEEQGVAAGIADSGSRGSVATLYGEALLLSLTDPYRLEAGEAQRIEALLADMRPALSLAREAPETSPRCHFLVPCNEDAPPSPLGNDATRFPPGARIFDTSAVVHALRAREAAASPAEAALLAKLVSLWDGPPRRVFRRESAQGSVAICVGVKPIAHFVAHDATADGEMETRALRDGITIPLRALPEDEGGRMIPIHEWAVINLSAGGLRLRRRAATGYPIVVGEVVGIRAPGKALWTVGVTRWIGADEEGTTEFGVQFFAEAACAVWIRGIEAGSTRKLGLLVSEGDQGDGESLLAPPGTHGGGGPYDVRGEGFRTRMRSLKLVEANSRFELFRVEPD